MKHLLLTSVLATTFLFAPLAQPVEAKTVSASSPSAICKDGTYSYSAHRQGTCSHHKGVKTWLKNLR